MIESDHSHLKRKFPGAQVTEPDKPMEPDCKRTAGAYQRERSA
jgi:hypothetical protein